MADLNALVQSLARFPGALRGLLEGVSETTMVRKSASGAWSIREVVLHLVIEEEEDFRPRLASLISDPSKRWAPIDPEGAVVAAFPDAAPTSELMDQFEKRRAASVEWIGSVSLASSLEAIYDHPDLGPLSAGDLITSWAAHDWLHARQIIKRLYEDTLVSGDGFSARYAGEWGI